MVYNLLSLFNQYGILIIIGFSIAGFEMGEILIK